MTTGYTLAKLLGRGATAETFAATDGLRALALKRLLPHAADHPAARAAFAREARILARLAGRGAPRLVHAEPDAAAPVLVTERFAGAPLARMSADALAKRFGAACTHTFAALAAVHEADDAAGPLAIVHGDVSPENVLVGDAQVVLVDFELAGDRDGRPPADGAFRGTLATVAPEVARGEPATVQADLFALAASLLTTLAVARGRAPLRDTAIAAAAGWVLAADVPVALDPAILAGVTTAAWATALTACLAHAPSARPWSARDVLSKSDAAQS